MAYRVLRSICNFVYIKSAFNMSSTYIKKDCCSHLRSGVKPTCKGVYINDSVGNDTTACLECCWCCHVAELGRFAGALSMMTSSHSQKESCLNAIPYLLQHKYLGLG